MGGDFSPQAVVEGCIEAVKELDVDIIITGPETEINKYLAKSKYNQGKITVLDASEVISTSEAPVMALRKKKDSSLVKALNLVKNGSADAIISAGSTGALMAGATLIVGRIKGIDRVALAPMLPGVNGSFMLIDSGANVDCKSEYLLQFALMGKVYFENVLNIKNPTIGLINIGTEEEKGNELTKSVYKMLKQADFNFIGNVEPRDVSTGNINILVCDGFIGNTILKMYEGVALNIFDLLKKETMSSTRYKIGGLLLKPVFKKLKKRFDYSEYGGSAFLGSKGVCIKAHGSSDAKAFKNSVNVAFNCCQNNIINKITTELESINKLNL
jgi:phosphate acyltransferase